MLLSDIQGIIDDGNLITELLAEDIHEIAIKTI